MKTTTDHKTAVSSSISLLLLLVVVDMFTSARARIDSVSDSVNGSHSLGGTMSRVESHPESSGFHPVSCAVARTRHPLR